MICHRACVSMFILPLTNHSRAFTIFFAKIIPLLGCYYAILSFLLYTTLTFIIKFIHSNRYNNRNCYCDPCTKIHNYAPYTANNINPIVLVAKFANICVSHDRYMFSFFSSNLLKINPPAKSPRRDINITGTPNHPTIIAMWYSANDKLLKM